MNIREERAEIHRRFREASQRFAVEMQDLIKRCPHENQKHQKDMFGDFTWCLDCGGSLHMETGAWFR